MKSLINKIKWRLYKRPKEILDLKEFLNNPDFKYEEKTIPSRIKSIQPPLHFEKEEIETITAIDLKKIEDGCTTHSVTSIKNGRYLQVHDRNVVMYKDSVIYELSFNGYWEPKPETVLTIPKYPPIKKLKGKVLCLSTTGAFNNYFTFTSKLVQRIGFAEDFGYKNEDYDSILINKINYPFQKELIKIFDLPENKIIETEEGSFYEAEDLIVPSLSIQNIFGNDYVHNKVLEKSKELNKTYPKRVFLSRKNAKWMNVVNENELDPLFKKYDISVVTFDDMSVLDQAQLLNNCELFITAHGAGLINILYCDHNANIIEILNRNRLNMVYYPYAIFQKLNYGYIYADAEEGQDGVEERFKHIRLKEESINNLEKMIRLMLKLNKE